jgi:DNA-directed RNA polymerase specialized sigma24 family protein
MVKDELSRTIERIARRYAMLCWWAEFEDLHQEAWVAALRAKQTWDPDRGVPLAGYAGRAVALSLLNYLWAIRSPVTGRVNHGPLLLGTRKVSAEVLLEFEAPQESPEAAAWWGQVQEVMTEVILAGRGGQIAAHVLLGGHTYQQVARRFRVPVARVQAFTRTAKSRLRASSKVRALAL